MRRNYHRYYFHIYTAHFYLQKQIIYPDIAKDNRFIFDETGLIPDMTCFFIPTTQKEWLPILNSQFFKFLAANYCPILGNINAGGRIRYKSTYLAKIPFPQFDENIRNEFSEKTTLIVSLHRELYDTKQKFIRMLQRKFKTNDFSQKIQAWDRLSFADLIVELAKKKMHFKLLEEAEWEDFFFKESSKTKDLSTKITDLNKELELAVSKLYQLTQQEMTII